MLAPPWTRVWHDWQSANLASPLAMSAVLYGAGRAASAFRLSASLIAGAGATAGPAAGAAGWDLLQAATRAARAVAARIGPRRIRLSGSKLAAS